MTHPVMTARRRVILLSSDLTNIEEPALRGSELAAARLDTCTAQYYSEF